MKETEPTLDPSIELSKFITRMWHHPLVSDITLQRREEALHKFSTIADELGFDLNECVVPLVGSLLWVTTEAPSNIHSEESDYDYSVIPLTAAAQSSLSKAGRTLWREDMDNVNFEVEDFKEKLISWDELIQKKRWCTQFSDLLLTPDEFIWGEPCKIWQMRLDVFELLNEDSYMDFEEDFQQYYKLSPKYHPKREQRVRQALELRAIQSSNPGLYLKRVNMRRQGNGGDLWGEKGTFDKFMLPPLQVWRGALSASKGEIKTTERFKAHIRTTHIQI